MFTITEINLDDFEVTPWADAFQTYHRAITALADRCYHDYQVDLDITLYPEGDSVLVDFLDSIQYIITRIDHLN